MPVCSSCGAVFRGVSRVRDAANASCARRAWIGPRSFVGGSTLSHGTSHSPRRLARPSCSWWSRGREWRFGTETAELGSLHGPATGRASAQLVQALAAHPRARPARLSKGTTHGASGGQPGDLQRRYGPRSRCWVWILRTGLRQGRATESGSPERPVPPSRRAVRSCEDQATARPSAGSDPRRGGCQPWSERALFVRKARGS